MAWNREAHRRALNLSRELSELPDRESYELATLEVLAGIFPCDDVFWLSVDLARKRAVIRRGDGRPAGSGDFPLDQLSDHPGIRAYLASPGDLIPRRVCDRGTLDRFQLTLVTQVDPGSQVQGWFLTRSACDFTEDELELAGLLVPALIVLDRLHPPGPAVIVEARTAPPPSRPINLTPREGQVLRLLAGGRTAEAIARTTGSSPRTAQKHLQHIYVKLGVNDRLLAVERARNLGLLA
jgi:DNA-binding CsgD family transcriptional regulator